MVHTSEDPSFLPWPSGQVIPILIQPAWVAFSHCQSGFLCIRCQGQGGQKRLLRGLANNCALVSRF